MTRTLIYGIIALIVVIVAALIAFVATDQGDDVRDTQTQPGFFEALFPFNLGGGEEQPLFEGENGGTGEPEAQPAPTLRQVSVDPVSGGFPFERDGHTYIRFINRATGHVYETVATSTQVTRVTNTTVPGIHEVLWVDENTFIVRYLNGDEPETFLARLSPSAEDEQRLDGVFLEPYVRAALDPQKENVLTIFARDNGSSFVLSEPDGSSARTVFTSPLAAWVPLQSETQLFAYTAPLSGFDGYLYQLSGSGLIKIAGAPGLTAIVSPSGQYALVSSGDGSTVNLFLVAVETGEVYESPVNTLAEKCTFDSEDETRVYCGVPDSLAGTAAYPNDWLLGRVSFSDTLWHIFFTTERAMLVSDLADAAAAIDVRGLTLNPAGTHLIFTNKNDLSLWSLQIRDPETEEN